MLVCSCYTYTDYYILQIQSLNYAHLWQCWFLSSLSLQVRAFFSAPGFMEYCDVRLLWTNQEDCDQGPADLGVPILTSHTPGLCSVLSKSYMTRYMTCSSVCCHGNLNSDHWLPGVWESSVKPFSLWRVSYGSVPQSLNDMVCLEERLKLSHSL